MLKTHAKIDVPDADFERATIGKQPSDEETAHKAAQQAHALTRNESQATEAACKKPLGLPVSATSCDMVHICTVAEAGVELSHDSSGNSTIANQSGAESGALDAQNRLCDADLAEVVQTWPSLPKALRAGILAMVRAARGVD